MNNLNLVPGGSIRSLVAVVLVSIVLSSVFFGCHTDPVHRQSQRQKEVLQETQKLYEKYLTGDVDDARRSLRETIRVFEECDGVTSSFRAANLFVECSRLYVLETLSGNTTAAKAAFVEVRYWKLKEHELRGDSPQKAMEAVEAFADENVLAMIRHENQSRGKEPEFISKLGKGARISPSTNGF